MHHENASDVYVINSLFFFIFYLFILADKNIPEQLETNIIKLA